MAIEEPQFRDFMKKIFIESGVDYDKWVNLLTNSQKEKIEEYTHFYYFICESETREEFRLIGMNSLIETLMQEVEFKDVFNYFESEYKDTNIIKDYQNFKKEYLEKFGAAKKIKEYFRKYITEEDQKDLFSNVEVFKGNKDDVNGKYAPLENVDQFASFLYQMRSEFVHQAKMCNFCPSHCEAAVMEVGDKYYFTDLNINSIMKIFERSYVKYWIDKFKSEHISPN